MKKVTAFLLLLVLGMSLLAGCGGPKDPSGAPSGTAAPSADPAPEPEPEPVLDPADFVTGNAGDNWGNGAGSNPSADGKDPWYPDGSRNTYITISAYDEGSESYGELNLYENGEMVGWNYCAAEDKHLIVPDKDGNIGRAFDLIFTDFFTAYDVESGEWFRRGDLAGLESALAGTWASEDGDFSMSFGRDGAYAETYGGADRTGAWELVNAYHVRVRFEDEDWNYEYFLYYAADGSPEYIMDTLDGKYLPE